MGKSPRYFNYTQELQSTNEELHSVNEELFTVNSEYKQKNDELARLNADFDKLLENTMIGTVFLDNHLRVRKFTPVATETLNLIRRDIGRPIHHISHNFTDYNNFSTDVKITCESGEFCEIEAKTNTGATFLIRMTPYDEINGEHHSVVITFIDISRLKQAEASITEHQSRLDIAEQLANLGSWDWDLKTDMITLDVRFSAVSGLGIEGVLDSKTFFKEIHRYSDGPYEETIRTKINAKDTLQYDWHFTLPNGTHRYLRGYGAVTRDRFRNPVHFRGILTDESEFRQQQEFVMQQKKDMETLLYVISHDLREPLRAIRNFSKFLSDGSQSLASEKSLNFLSRILHASERMDLLLNEVSELSRLKRNSDPFEYVQGNQIVERAIKNLENRIEQSGASITVARDLPELKVNKTWAIQAIFNLIANALKFVKEGESPEILITPYVAPKAFSNHVGIVVQDRGPGVPAESAERIFKLFQRAVGKDVEGTGAGLAIVKEVAKKHGGEVFYESRIKGGSKFTITFQK
ncbi:MAG: PAS domain-containing protein [Opitutales bacterium]|nr:PAS domain-containing protein [Opitutales bacterium]NRA28446.1 PAS domain-containing protein [Opitutales bacterium]